MTTTKQLLTVATLAIGVGAIPAKDIAAQPKDDGFIFSSNSVSSALDHRQSLRLGERLTFAQLKRRLHSYKVERSRDCEGECIHVVGQNGVYLELNSGEPISVIMGFLGSRDILGHVIGMSLIKAVGSDKASCECCEPFRCASKLIKNMHYAVDDYACPDEDKFDSPEPAVPYRLPDCWTVAAIGIAQH